MRLFLISSLLVACSNIASCYDLNKDIIVSLTLDLDSKLTCFYQTLKEKMMLSVFVDPSVTIKVAARLTSPSGEFSEWMDGIGKAVHMTHNVTETGDYEVCIGVPYQAKVFFHLFAFDPNDHLTALDKLNEQSELNRNLTNALTTLREQLYRIYYSIKFYNQVSVRDEALQQKNADFIKTYVVLFCISAAIASIVEVTLVRRMFRIDPSRIRI